MTGTIDPDQAAQLLGISLSEVRALVKARVIPKVNLAGELQEPGLRQAE
jgi:hypothetical protein